MEQKTSQGKYYVRVRARVRNAPSPVVDASSPAGNASSPGGDASPRRHLLVKARCLDKQIQYIFLLPSWGIAPQLGNADAGTRLLKKAPMYDEDIDVNICVSH